MEPELHRFRYQVVQNFLLSGTPLQRLSFFQAVLERANFTLGDPSDLAVLYISMIEGEEFKRLKGDVSGHSFWASP